MELVSPRGSTLVSVLCWALASSATALLAHGLMGIAAGLCAAPEYREHAHIAVAPVTLIAVATAAALLLSVVLRTIARQHASDPVVLLARALSRMHPAVPILSITSGGLGALVAMEFFEQFCAFGHVTGLADALGGIAPLSVAIVIAVAIAVAFIGLRCANFFIDRVVTIVDEFMAWLRADGIGTSFTGMRRRNARARANVSCVYFTRSFGLRAPPLLLV